MPDTTYRYWDRTGSRVGATLGALQLVLPAGAPAPAPVRLARARWTPEALAALRAIQTETKALQTTHPVSVPHRALVGALQAHVPEAVMVHGKMAETWIKGDLPILEFHAGVDEDVVRRKIGEAVAAWCAGTLARFAERVGLRSGVVAGLGDLVHAGRLVDVERTEAAMPPDAKQAFLPARDALLAIVARELAGVEPFADPRIGPLHRVVRSKSDDNSVDFVSWPFESEGGLVSAVMKVFVETAPWTSSPIVRVEASKRRWCPSVPAPYHFGRQKNVVAYAMLRDRHVAVNMPLSLTRERTPADIDTPAYVLSMLSGRQVDKVGRSLSEILSKGPDERVFIGLPYKTTYEGLLPRGGPQAGASTRDNVEAFAAVEAALAPYGFTRASGEGVRVWRLHGSGKPVFLKPAHLARAIAARTEDAVGRPSWPNEVGMPVTTEDHDEELARLRVANDARLDRAHGAGTKLRIRVFARTALEHDVTRLAVEALFGDRVSVDAALLPPNTHGPFRIGDRRPQRARSDAVLEAWREACDLFIADAERVAPEAPRLALVIAPMTFSLEVNGKIRRLRDDRVAKPAARTALAEYAGANSQFLVPWSERAGLTADELTGFLLRAQAALNDLVFGHAGLMEPLGIALAKAFPDEKTRPTCILALTVIKKNRSQTGGDKSAVLAAIRVDAETAKCTVRLGWRYGGTPDVTPWVPYGEALRRVAATTVGSIGTGRPEYLATTGAFVRTVLDDLVQQGERALVLIDATGLSGLWPWIADRGITGSMVVDGNTVDPAVAYPGFRFVRLRSRGIPRVVTSQSAVFQAMTETGELVDGTETMLSTPTVTAGIVTMTGSADPIPHYITTLSYGDINMRPARGQSALAQDVQFVKLGPEHSAWPQGVDGEGRDIHERREDASVAPGPYRKPLCLELTMPVLALGDSPDLIAALVMHLRSASAHTNAKTFQPAPVSFEGQIKNYMAKYILEEEDLPEEEMPEDDPVAGEETDADG